MKVTASICALFLSATTVVGAAAPLAPHRELQIGADYQITFVGTTAVTGAGPDDIQTVFTHSDVTNEEADDAVYGTVDVKYYKVTDPTCYDAFGDIGTTCTCSPVNEVTVNGGGNIYSSITTDDNTVVDDNLATTTIIDELAPLINSDAASKVGDLVYVAYCLRLSLLTDPGALKANSQDVLIFFTGTNDPDATITVTARPEGNDNGGVSVADFTVTAELCPGQTTGANVGTPLLEGTDVSICIKSNDDPAARIVSITTWNWQYTRITGGGAVISQSAIGGTAAANALTTYSTADCTTTAPTTCRFTTLFGTAIYDAMVQDGVVTGSVVGTGVVEMKFNGEARRARVLLEAGDVFPSPAELDLVLAARQEEEGSCNCFFLNIFCWIICLLASIFSF